MTARLSMPVSHGCLRQDHKHDGHPLVLRQVPMHVTVQNGSSYYCLNAVPDAVLLSLLMPVSVPVQDRSDLQMLYAHLPAAYSGFLPQMQDKVLSDLL